MASASNIDILIIGAGPTGLALACDLARRGRSFRIIDRKPGPSTIMKATVLTPGSLEYFEDLGLFDRVRETGTDVRNMAIYADGKVALRKGWEHLDAPHRYMLLLGQHYTERFLYERLKELGADVDWQCTLTSLDVNESGVTALCSWEGQPEESISARFLVGCDGSKSAVAKSLGTEYRDHDFATDYVVAEIEIAADLEREDWHIFFTKAGPLAIGAMPKGLWGMMAALPPLPDGKSRIGTEPTLEELQALWDERAPVPAALSNPRWMSHYRTHLRSMKGSSPWPVVLAGDAAHQVSPLSSLGMNSGILDARNLAWRLDLACRGLAGPELLSSYDYEHRKEWEPAAALTMMNETAYPWRATPLRFYRDWSYRILLNFGPIWDYYVKFQSQKDRSLRRSPIVEQTISSPVHRGSSPHLSDHGSCMQAWLAFGEGPHAGDLTRDVPGLIDAATGERFTLFQQCFGGQHTLLIFSGCDDPDADMRTNYHAIAKGCAGLPEGLLQPIFVHRGESLPSGLWEGRTLLDPTGAAHARYGAEGEALYLLRPDGYVGYRAMPPLWEPFAGYLQRTFGIQAEQTQANDGQQQCH